MNTRKDNTRNAGNARIRTVLYSDLCPDIQDAYTCLVETPSTIVDYAFVAPVLCGRKRRSSKYVVPVPYTSAVTRQLPTGTVKEYWDVLESLRAGVFPEESSDLSKHAKDTVRRAYEEIAGLAKPVLELWKTRKETVEAATTALDDLNETEREIRSWETGLLETVYVVDGDQYRLVEPSSSDKCGLPGDIASQATLREILEFSRMPLLTRERKLTALRTACVLRRRAAEDSLARTRTRHLRPDWTLSFGPEDSPLTWRLRSKWHAVGDKGIVLSEILKTDDDMAKAGLALPFQVLEARKRTDGVVGKFSEFVKDIAKEPDTRIRTGYDGDRVRVLDVSCLVELFLEEFSKEGHTASGPYVASFDGLELSKLPETRTWTKAAECN